MSDLKPDPQRAFFIAILLAIVVILLVRYWVIPGLCIGNSADVNHSCGAINLNGWQITAKVLEDLFASAAVTLAIAIFMFYLTLRDKRIGITVSDWKEIESHFERARKETKEWLYKGGTGTYLKATTLPEMARLARDSRRHAKISIEIIDPGNIDMCTRYATHRNGLGKSKSNQWDVRRVRIEALATILTICAMQKEQSRLHFEVGVSKQFSHYRYDMGSEVMIITTEDPRAPAIVVDRGPIFTEFENEIVLSFEQSKKLDLTEKSSIAANAVTTDQVKQLFASLRFTDNTKLEIDDLNDSDYEQIITKFQHPTTEYVSKS